MRIQALGVEIVLAIEDPKLVEIISPLLAHFAKEQGESRAVVEVRGHGPWQIASPASTGVVDSRPQALSGVLTAINLTAVAGTPYFACHAAVLTRAGRTLVVPAPSGMGKTTLTAALLRRGWDYVSDEALCLRWDDGSIVAYPRPLALSEWAAKRLGDPEGVRGDGERILLPEALGGRPSFEASRIGHIVCLVRDGSSADLTPILRPIHRADAVQELLRRSFNHYRDPVAALRLLADTTKGAMAWRLRLGDPHLAAEVLTQDTV